MVAIALLAFAFGSARPAVESAFLAFAFATAFGSLLPIFLVITRVPVIIIVVLGRVLLRRVALA